MNLHDLVRPLEPTWQAVVDAVLTRRGAPTTQATGRLGVKVAVLSRTYNAGEAGRPGIARTQVPLEARIGFSFARDVPKGAAAVRELIGAGAIVLPRDRPLRVLDLGAGLGAMTWGIVRALAASGATGAVEALLVDEDEAALAVASQIAQEAASRLPELTVKLTVKTRVQRLTTGMRLPVSDVVVLGQVLSELDTSLTDEERASSHAQLLGDVLANLVAPDGSLIVVEPALRDRTRHLHAVRDRLLESPAAADVALFAPCLHRGGCPALREPDDWCHEDLPVDLPPWLVPVARAAGLRFQGLTFSYLVLRRDARSLARELGVLAPGRVRLRVVSERIVTKGKIELFACTETGERVRLRRLDRDRTAASAAWDELERGDVVGLSVANESAKPGEAGARKEPGIADSPPGNGPIDERGRLAAHVAVDVWRGTQ